MAAADRKKKKKTEKKGPGAVEFLGNPKMWVDEQEDGWLIIGAFVTGGDSSRRIGSLRIRMGALELEIGNARDIWFSVPDLKRRVVPARTGIWLPTIEKACTELAKDDLQMEITISGEQVVTTTKSFELPPEFVEDVRDACRRQQG